MSSKYDIVKQNNSSYDIFQIKLSNGKKCLFWKKKDIKTFDEIVTIFNNDNVTDIRNNQIFLSFHGVTSKEDINDLMIAFGTEAYKNGLDITKVDFKFVVDNKDEEDIANDFMKKFRLKGKINHSEKYSQLTENLDAAISEIATNREANRITKQDNGVISNYVVDKEKIYNDVGSVSIAERQVEELQDWKKDMKKTDLSTDELKKESMDYVTKNYKSNYLEKPSNSVDTTDFSVASKDKATREDGMVNSELGIIVNNPSNDDKFSTIEKDGNNIVLRDGNKVTTHKENLEVDKNSSADYSYHVDTVTTGVDSSFWDDDDLGSINRGVIESNDEDLPIYYVGDEGEIYNQYGKFVGMNEVGGKQVVGDKLKSAVNGEVIGQIDNINNMEKNAKKEKGKVRVYKPNRQVNYNRSNKDSGRISLPVIIFIISLFLLIGSGVILYLMK